MRLKRTTKRQQIKIQLKLSSKSHRRRKAIFRPPKYAPLRLPQTPLM